VSDYWLEVEDLLVKHRAKEALRRLMSAGCEATPALRRGLHHPTAEIRVHCCRILDHFLDEDALPDLIECLGDSDDAVRARALHTLACERCKEGECRPAEAAVFPVVLRMLEEDPSYHVRIEAVKLLFTAVHRRADALTAIERVRDSDAHPAVRRAATLRAPGGVMFMRSSPVRTDRRTLRTSNPRGHLRVRG
jgi:HEAT repeat protein